MNLVRSSSEPRVTSKLGQVRVRVARRQDRQLLEVRDPIHGRGPSQHVSGHVARGSPSGGRCARAGWVWLLRGREDFAARRARCRRAGVPAGASRSRDNCPTEFVLPRSPRTEREGNDTRRSEAELVGLPERFLKGARQKKVEGARFGASVPGLRGRLRRRRRVGLPHMARRRRASMRLRWRGDATRTPSTRTHLHTTNLRPTTPRAAAAGGKKGRTSSAPARGAQRPRSGRSRGRAGRRR